MSLEVDFESLKPHALPVLSLSTPSLQLRVRTLSFPNRYQNLFTQKMNFFFIKTRN